MSKLVPFSRHHIPYISDVGAAEPGPGAEQYRDPLVLSTLERANSWTLLDDEGIPVGCGGTIAHWPGRHHCWAYLSARSAEFMLSVTRSARKLLEGAGPGRFEFDVREDFVAGHRWAKLLGFEVETPKKPRFGIDGSDFVGYVRFQG